MNALKNNTLIARYLSKLVLGEVQQFKNMGVIPLFTSANHSPEYLTLKEALEKNLATVKEVSITGSVPELKVTNQAKFPILLLDGEELTGAKQNRAFNISILLREKSVTVIPVSCTEQGRWHYASSHFGHSGHVMAAKLRKLKSSQVAASLKRSHSYLTDQEAIWGEVHAMAASAKVQTPTHALHDVFQAKRVEVGDYLNAFKLVPSQKGLLVFVNGEVAGLDVVSLEQAYQVLHPTLLRSYAIDAVLEQTDKVSGKLVEKASAFFYEASKCGVSKHRSPGYGSDCRFESRAVAGSALVHGKSVIHMALFPFGGPDSGRGI